MNNEMKMDMQAALEGLESVEEVTSCTQSDVHNYLTALWDDVELSVEWNNDYEYMESIRAEVDSAMDMIEGAIKKIKKAIKLTDNES